MQNEMQPLPPQPSRAGQFWLGIGLGSIPLVLALITVGSLSSGAGGILLIITLLLYCVLLIAAIVCLIVRDVRYLGYGLLTMVCTIPIIAVVACAVLLAGFTSHP